MTTVVPFICSAHHNGRRYLPASSCSRVCALRSVRRQTERSANPAPRHAGTTPEGGPHHATAEAHTPLGANGPRPTTSGATTNRPGTTPARHSTLSRRTSK